MRLVQIHPNKLLGAVAHHGDFPVERIKMDRRDKWMGSVSHDSILKMTDLEGALEDSDEDENEGDDSEDEESAAEKDQEVVHGDGDGDQPVLRPTRYEDEDAEDDSDVPTEPRSKKRKKKARQNAKKRDGGVDPGFFSGL